MSTRVPRRRSFIRDAALARPGQPEMTAASALRLFGVLIFIASSISPATTAAITAATILGPRDASARTIAPTPAAPQTAPRPSVRPRTIRPRDEAGGAAGRPGAGTKGPSVARREDDAPEEVGEDEVVRVDSNLVVIPASVTDGRGRAITTLRLEDFELRVDGEVQPIGDLSRAETPVSITLLFDNSSSLSAAREFEKQAAVRFFRSIIRPVDRAAVFSISTTPSLAQPLTNDVNRLVGTVEQFGQPDGATALFDAVAQAADYMVPVAGRKVLVLVTDGTDTVSDLPFEDAIIRALRAECQVYVVQTRRVEEPNLRDPVSEERMQKLSEQTGGAVFVPQTIEDLDAAFSQIALDLSQQYLLSYYPQRGRRDNYFRSINLGVRERPNLRVRARKGFYPHAAAGPPALEAAAATKTNTSGRPAAPPGGDAGLAANSRPLPDAVIVESRPRPAEPDDRRTARKEPDAAVTTTPASLVGADPRPPEQVAKAARATESAAAVRLPPPPPAEDAPASRPAAPVTPERIAAGVPAATGATPAIESPAGVSPRAAPAEERKLVSGGVLNAKALSLPRPAYPPTAKAANIYGVVAVEVTVDEKGKVVEAKAVSGPRMLHGAAAAAARQARFSPTTLSGAPVRVTGTISYNFVRP